MTDEELIKWLRGWHMAEMNAVADRIEQLVKERDAMLRVVTDNHMALQRAEVAEAKLAKAIEALDEAIYLLDPDEEDMAKEAGLYRIVTARAKLEETE